MYCSVCIVYPRFHAELEKKIFMIRSGSTAVTAWRTICIATLIHRGGAFPLVAYLVERLYLWLLTSPRSCARVCAHVCACALAVCAGVLCRAGPKESALPYVPTSAGWREARVGRVPQARTRAVDLPPLTIPFVVLCSGSHPALGWIMGHTLVRAEKWVTLTGLCPCGDCWGHTHRAVPSWSFVGVTLIGRSPRGFWVTLGLCPSEVCGPGCSANADSKGGAAYDGVWQAPSPPPNYLTWLAP